MGDSDQSLAKIKINILCSPLVHQPGHFVIDSYQVGQAIISFCKSRLTTPNHCLVLGVFGIGFQYYFPIKFPRIKVRLTGLQCPGSSCLSLKIEVTFAFFHFSGLSQLPWSFKDDQKQSHNDIGQLPQHLCVYPISSHGLVYVWFV